MEIHFFGRGKSLLKKSGHPGWCKLLWQQ